MKDIFDILSTDDYSRIRNYDEDDTTPVPEIDDTVEMDITELIELDVEGVDDED